MKVVLTKTHRKLIG